jgi:polyisoprenoid-binding protein YceI
VKDPWGNTRIGAQATTKINRQDFGIVFHKALDGGGVLVGDEIAITIDVEVMKKGDAPAH